MSKHLSITRFLSAVLLLDILLIGFVSVTGTKADALLSGLLPGKFGPGMGPHMTGNHLLGALILYLDAVLFLMAGFLVLLNASRHTLLISSGGIGRLLRGTAGLSQEEIAAAGFAVAEEQKSEIRSVHAGRRLVWIGAALLLLAFPGVCFTYAQADPSGAALLRDAGGAVANSALTMEDAAVFAVDQLADAVLLDIPQVYRLHLTSLAPGDTNLWLKHFVLMFHILAKLIVISILFAWWRSGHLRSDVLALADMGAARQKQTKRDTPPAPMHPGLPQDIPPPPVHLAANDHNALHEHRAADDLHVPHETHLDEPAAADHKMTAGDEPQPLEASILDVPVYVEPPRPQQDATPPAAAPNDPHDEHVAAVLAPDSIEDEVVEPEPTEEKSEEKIVRREAKEEHYPYLAYKNTALHLNNQD